MTDGPQERIYSENSSYWSAWRTADALLEQLNDETSSLRPYESTARQVVDVLRAWGDEWAGTEEMKSFLRKKEALLHETEESIIALHHLREWWKAARLDSDSFVAIDICCGKGYFSMYLTYLVGMFWGKEDQGIDRPKLDHIILFDKATDSELNWHHVDAANGTADSEGRPLLELWPGTNIHDYDVLLTRLINYQKPLVMIGIHLCKMLSPAFVSLVNGLGKQCCFVCLAPCCLPRRVTKKGTDDSAARIITVYQYETEEERKRRQDYTALRRQARQCYLCRECSHLVRKCPLFPTEEKERSRILEEAVVKTSPCWNCGMLGHFSADCPIITARKPSTTPPMRRVDASQIVSSPQPFAAYCKLLSSSLEGVNTIQVVETGILNQNAASHGVKSWNAARKSIYIIATAKSS